MLFELLIVFVRLETAGVMREGRPRELRDDLSRILDSTNMSVTTERRVKAFS